MNMKATDSYGTLSPETKAGCIKQKTGNKIPLQWLVSTKEVYDGTFCWKVMLSD
jgi:hypothetical protein